MNNDRSCSIRISIGPVNGSLYSVLQFICAYLRVRVEPGEHSFMESLIALLSPVRRPVAFLQRVNEGKSDIRNMYTAPLHLFHTLPVNQAHRNFDNGHGRVTLSSSNYESYQIV